MNYRDGRGFTDTQDNQKDFNEKYIDKNSGPFMATVKYVNDPQRMGRLGVNIPALTHTTKPTAKQITWCQYLSPFYGVKSLGSVNGADPYGYKSSQTRYGMWAIPPDIDTSVLVIFAKGDGGRTTAFWMGCVQEPLTNQQVPGHGSTEQTSMPAGLGDYTQTKVQTYGTDLLPAGEKNRKTTDVPVQIELQKYPINERLAEQLTGQGLIQDTARGTTTSSARRESPSAVFGMSTPGRIDAKSSEPRIGLGGSPVKVDRESGHSFVMDDGATDGTNQLVRLRTASGHQLLMNDSEGVVYIANGSGKAFIEMDTDGTVSVYSDSGINLRAGQDFNLHSDKNINFHAKGNINFSAETDVAISAERYAFTMGEKGILNASQGGSVRNFAQEGITSYTPGPQLHGAAGVIHLAGSQVHMNSTGASDTWGPKWLTPDAIGIKVTQGDIDIDDDRPFRPYRDKKDDRVVGVDKNGNDIVIKGAVPNKINNRTTVSEFVTHEPYDRQSSTQRIRKYINEVIAVIKKQNPKLTAQEIKDIKTEMLKQKSVKQVADKLGKLVKENKEKIKIPVKELNELVANAQKIDALLKTNVKSAAVNFVVGQATQAAVSFVKSYFAPSGLTKFGGFCFDPDTLVQMADGSEKKIKDINLGDNTKGGEVTGVFQFTASDEMHDYKGVTVAGSHYVKENDEFIMVKDSPLAIKIDKIPVVYSLDTTGRRIFINNIEFADYNGDSVAKNFLNNAGVDFTGFDKEVLRQVEQRLI